MSTASQLPRQVRHNLLPDKQLMRSAEAARCPICGPVVMDLIAADLRHRQVFASRLIYIGVLCLLGALATAVVVLR